MPIYTFRCKDCDTKQDIRVSKYLSDGEVIRDELCISCMGDQLEKVFTEATPKAKGCITPGRRD